MVLLDFYSFRCWIFTVLLPDYLVPVADSCCRTLVVFFAAKPFSIPAAGFSNISATGLYSFPAAGLFTILLPNFLVLGC